MPLTRAARLALEAAFVGALGLAALATGLGLLVALAAVVVGLLVAVPLERRLRRVERAVPTAVARLQLTAAAAYVGALAAGLAYVSGADAVLLAFLWLVLAALGALLMTAAIWQYRENRPR